jgi:hypothetical protein
VAIIPKKVQNQYPFHFQPSCASAVMASGSKTDATWLNGAFGYQQILAFSMAEFFDFEILTAYSPTNKLDFHVPAATPFVQLHAFCRPTRRSLQIHSG